MQTFQLMLRVTFGSITILLLMSSSQTAEISNATEPDLNSDRVVMKNSIAYHFIKHVRSIEANVLITRRISISPLVVGIQQLSDTKDKLKDFCSTIVENIKKAYGGHISKVPARGRRSLRSRKRRASQCCIRTQKRERRTTKGPEPQLILIADPTLQMAQDICDSITSHISEIEGRSKSRIAKILSLIDISIDMNATRVMSRHKRSVMDKSKRSIGMFLLKSGIRSVWSLFGFVEGIRTNRRLNRLEKEVAQLQMQQDKTSSMVDHLTLVVTNHSILIEQLHVTTSKLVKQVNDLSDKVNNLDEKILYVRSIFQVTTILDLLQSVVDRTRDAMDHGFYILEHIVDKALMSETSAHLLPVDEIRKVQVEVSIFSNAILDPEYQRIKSVIVADPDDPEFLRAVISVAALSRRHHELIELIPVPLFRGDQALVPYLSHSAAILDHEEGLFIPLDPREMADCLRNEHCATTGPELRTNTVACGIPQFFDWNKEQCDFEPILSNGIFLKRLGSDGIIFSLKEQVTAQLFCSAIPSQSRTLKGSGVLQMPAGCKLAIVMANGDITRIRSPPDTQIVQAQDLVLIVAGPGQLMHTKSLDSLGNTSTLLSRAINEHLINIEKQIDVTVGDVSYHWTVVLSLSIVLGIVCLLIVALLMLLYRYSSRFRRKVKTVRNELQGVGDKIIAFEREAAARGRRDERPLIDPPSNFGSIIRNLDKMEHHAKMNEYLNFGSNSSLARKDFGEFNKYGFTKYLDTSKPIPKPRAIYPSVPPRSEIYSLAEDYLKKKEEYEKLPPDRKSQAPAPL